MDNIFFVERAKDTVIVSIMKNKSDGSYSFVNLTKGHICTCHFNSVQEALEDLEQERLQGKVISYTPLVLKK